MALIEADLNLNSEQPRLADGPTDVIAQEFSTAGIMDLAEIDEMLANKSLPAGFRTELRIRQQYVFWKMKIIPNDNKLLVGIVSAIQAVEKPENEGEEGFKHLTKLVPDPQKRPGELSYRIVVLKQELNAEFDFEPKRTSGKYSGR